MNDDIYENLDKEEQLVSLLGLTINGHCDNKYFVKDEKGNVVGTITKRLKYNKNIKKNWCKVYEYQVKIETDLYFVDYARTINDRYGNIYVNDNSFAFDIKSKDENGEELFNRIELYLSDAVSVNVRSKENGCIEFLADETRFNLNYKKGNLEENIAFTPDYYGYVAIINNGDKTIQLNIYVEKQNDHWVNITEQEWHNGELVSNQRITTKGVVKDAVLLHEDGIASFNFFINHMKYIKELAPYSDTILETLKKNKENNFVLKLSNL